VPTKKTPVNWLRAFEVAARHLSMSAAALELSVTPAAVSQQIRLLELRLGQKLFVRHARGLRLTPAGETLVPACRESFERLDATLTELFGNRGRQQLVIRVSVGFARQWLLQKVTGFAQKHPEISVRLVATVWAADPLDPGIDVDIRLAAGGAAGMESHQLTHDEVFPVCSPLLASGPPRLRRPADLHRQTLLASVGFAEGWRHWLVAAGIEHEGMTFGPECDCMPFALEMAAMGQGVALARSSYAEDFLRAGRLKRLFDVRLPATDNVYVSIARGAEARSPASRFRDWLMEKAVSSRAGRRITKA
jgi:LysR family glycine cleavage system transcriptional activator